MLSRSTPKTGLAVLATVLMTAGLITLWSSAAPAAPVTLEAESAALSGGARVETEHAGGTGSGYVGGFTDANRGTARITFTTTATAGPNSLTLRYANGTGSTRTLTLTVNGSARQLPLPATAGWASWGTATASVALNAGGNTIAVAYGSGDSGNVNLDHLALDPTPVATGTLEAESATLSGGARVETEHAGGTGTGYVGGFTDANRGTARATFTTAATAGPNSLTLRYANGTGSTRTLTLTVNGAARQVSLPTTASWSTWGEVTTSVALTAGSNTVAVAYGDSDSGNVNLDHVRLTTAPTTTTTPGQPGPAGSYELETAFTAGGATTTTSPAGATGAGSVVLPGVGALVTRTVNQAGAGTATVTLRYTNPASSARTITLYANGIRQRQLSLPAGGGWQTTTHQLALRTGLNLIGYRVVAGDTGGVQLDHVTVTNTRGLAQRGATVPYTTHEAEAGAGNGTRISGRAYTTEAAEASGRAAVKLTGTGRHVEITLTAPANAVTVRAGLPDSAAGTGTTAPLAVYADGAKVRDLALTSKYSWMYGPYPFAGAPGGERPHRYFDDARALLPRTYPAGTVLRFAKDTDATPYITVDLIDTELVDPAFTAPAGYVDVTAHGARPNDGVDDTAALRAAVSAARGTATRGVWIPAGTFSVPGLITFSGVDLRGAGPWHTVLQGSNRRGGFYVNGGDAQLADLTFDGDVTTRDPDGAPNSDAFVEGEFGTGSLVFNVATNHAKVGLWVKAANGLHVVGARIRNTMADGVNVNGETANVRVEQSSFRNTGDDALAMWSWESAGTVSRSVFAFNTVALPVLANGVAIYGGTDNRAEDNLISDTVFNGSGVMVSTWHASKPFGGTTAIQRNTLTRTGSRHWDWHTHTGAVWLFAERADITGAVVLRDLQVDDSSYHGLLLSWQRAIGDLTVGNVRINGTGGATDSFDDGAGTVTNANSNGMHFDQVTGTGRFDDVVVSGVRGAGSQALVNVGNTFTVQRGAGNSGW
ncbi:carbohydrate-binding protein [Saccharothrix lopnurensis]|uniref:Carbohydrate-binding protein n=1 Tax=Saccharothrix lopnurensis TaxID=1670621 RepID=A0ABW1P855_9PSEU